MSADEMKPRFIPIDTDSVLEQYSPTEDGFTRRFGRAIVKAIFFSVIAVTNAPIVYACAATVTHLNDGVGVVGAVDRGVSDAIGKTAEIVDSIMAELRPDNNVSP